MGVTLVTANTQQHGRPPKLMCGAFMLTFHEHQVWCTVTVPSSQERGMDGVGWTVTWQRGQVVNLQCGCKGPLGVERSGGAGPKSSILSP